MTIERRPALRSRLGVVNWKLAGAVAGVVLGGGVLAIAIASSGIFGDSEMIDSAKRRVVIDHETGEVFQDFAIPTGSSYPWRNPRTGTDSLYPAERCYWTADGKAKIEPTYVYVEAAFGGSGRTTCPDCGRPVVPHNPMPPTELMLEAAQGG